MKQIVLSQFDLPWIPLTGLILFVLTFLMYVVWTFRKENQSFYEDIAKIPLDAEKGDLSRERQ